jgi:hypothetical protein
MKNLIFDEPFLDLGQVLFNFGARDDPKIKIRKFFDGIAMAVEAGDTSEDVKAGASNEAQMC